MAFAAEPMPVAAPASDAKSLAFLMTCSTWVVATEALVPSARAMSACAKSPMSFNASGTCGYQADRQSWKYTVLG